MTRSAASRLHVFASGLLLLIGTAHVAVTFIQYESASLDALWFLGSGFFVLTAGAFNLLVAASHTPAISQGLWTIVLLTNGMGGLLAAGFMWLTGLKEPQGLLLLLAFVACGAAMTRVRTVAGTR